MEFAQITYTKTVEGNFEVSLIHNNVVVAKITFPTEELAKEYVDIKTKLNTNDILGVPAREVKLSRHQ